MTAGLATPQARRAAAACHPPCDDCTPADRYGELFVAVQGGRVFPDSKTFVDCAPRGSPEAIVRAWEEARARPGFDLAAFVHAHFEPPQPVRSDWRAQPGQPLFQHIDGLWPVLRREPDLHPHRGSLLPLPHPYIVPGGRFAELYYWDSYFTMLGLAHDGQQALLHHMTENFAYLVDTYGRIPNGTRTYYLSRSHPPVFSFMVELAQEFGGPPASHYLPQLRREHAFWMQGEAAARPGVPSCRVVALEGGAVLNRYWDDRGGPREESWREDVATAARSGRPADEVYRHLRAAAESGWDFSSRWLAEDAAGGVSSDLATIRTTDLVPVDLNAFLWSLERLVARLAAQQDLQAVAGEFEHRARARREAMDTLLWDEGQGHWVDYDWRLQRQRRALTAAAAVPLFCGLAGERQADRTAQALATRLLAPGGLGTTEDASGEQWDRPNGWAPLQWMAVEGLRRYGHGGLADRVRDRWLATVTELYRREGKVVEKYALRQRETEAVRGGHGGEYPLQDGFGWTNGVVRRWLADLPGHSAGAE